MKWTAMTLIMNVLVCIAATAIVWMALDSWKFAFPDPKSMQVTDKHDAEGKCYIQTWIEVTPEEYIGLDIGDEYESAGEWVEE